MTNESKWELWLKTLTLIGALVAALWSIYVYQDTREKEFYSSFWNKKMELYIGVSEAASTLATTDSPKAFAEAQAAYWGYFYGRLSVVEDETVKNAMQVFSSNVPETGIPPKLPIGKGQEAYALAIALKRNLLESWRHPFQELEQ